MNDNAAGLQTGLGGAFSSAIQWAAYRFRAGGTALFNSAIGVPPNSGLDLAAICKVYTSIVSWGG